MTIPYPALEHAVHELRDRGFLPLVVPSDTDRVYQGLVRHHDGLVEVLVLRTEGPTSLLRARTINDRSRPTALAEEIVDCEGLDPVEAAQRLLQLIDAPTPD